MSQLNINLPEDVAERLRDRAARAGHDTVEEFVQALIFSEVEEEGEDYGAPPHLTVESEEELKKFLEPRLDDNGGSIELTPEFREQFMRELRQRRTKGKGYGGA